MATIRADDLFCGSGGSSMALAQACEAAGYDLDLFAVNHWPLAVETHSANHPKARHLCASLDSVNPSKERRGRLDILLAGPECVHHSIARGGKPINDQSRASAWCVVRWAEARRPRAIVVENVREFRTWGPLNDRGRPLKSRKGETFAAWLSALESLGYTVEHRVLCAADYGDPTTRERLFVVGVRGKGPVPWPEPTHSREPRRTLFEEGKAKWRAAREVIDWSIAGQSIFNRSRPLADKTLRRIEAGLKRFRSPPFLVSYYGNGRPESVDEPLDTVTTRDRFGLVSGTASDIRFRMLRPHELAAAMSFPAGYVFRGGHAASVRQIGNAWPVATGRALCRAVLERIAG